MRPIYTSYSSYIHVVYALYMCTPCILALYVVVQIYSWFEFYFSLFETHYHTLPYPKTKGNKIQTKDSPDLARTKSEATVNKLIIHIKQ